MSIGPDRFTPAQLELRDVRRRALGSAIADPRKAAGLTQDQLAAASGVNRPTISRLEQWTSSLGSDRIWDLAQACGVTPADLFAAAQEGVRVARGRPSRRSRPRRGAVPSAGAACLPI